MSSLWSAECRSLASFSGRNRGSQQWCELLSEKRTALTHLSYGLVSIVVSRHDRDSSETRMLERSNPVSLPTSRNPL